ncbi:hypothetical protein [Bradyrhizobium sp. URHC0002]
MSTDLKALVTGLYDLLEPAEPGERKKAIKAALTMLGDDTSVANEKGEKSNPNSDEDVVEGDFNAKTRTWMTRNKVTAEQLNQVFHIDGETVDIIVDSAPGKNQKQQTINAYLLTGIREFIKTGEPKLDDKSGRESCERMGCYGPTNHATYMGKPGNVLSGSKDGGWSLTGPGMKAGADLIKEMTTGEP